MKKAKKSKPLSWTPKLRGRIYCAPACGMGCTKAAHDEAERKAGEIAKQLGPDWSVRMNENLGWYAKAVCGDLSVEATRGFDDPEYAYWALLNIYETPAHGPGGILYGVYDKTPREALNALLKEALAGENMAVKVHRHRVSQLAMVRSALFSMVIKEVT